MAPSHVLVPLDGSPLAKDALEHALDVFDCEITVLNVVTPLDTNMSEGGILEVEESRLDAAYTQADRLIERARDRSGAVGRSIETTVETGEPADTILAYIDTSNVDHVVLGGHGGPPSPFHRLLGTVATTVVNKASVSVTVIR
ncbi:universal stress protein [Halosolutus halophilus]|uniref:universal stress protein n=1 Tax=Halosolutus halophilus TaxID=1552990 RepID=UPI0022352FBE|nr:universal stress protein [Halosolutus halophilus]